MLPTDFNGAVCEVKALNNKLIATGVISDIDVDMVEVYDAASSMPILQLETPVKLITHHPKLGVRVLAGRIYISNRVLMRLVNLQNYAEYEKRRFFRLAIDHSAVLVYPVEDPHDAERTVYKEMPVRVKDISLCGMLIECGRTFSIGDEMKVRMTLAGNELATMNLMVRRLVERGDGMAYGCEILDLPYRVEQQLSAFIFRQQQEQIRRSRGK